jgi:hypothetical protein
MKPKILVIFIPNYFVLTHYTYFGLAQRRFVEC